MEKLLLLAWNWKILAAIPREMQRCRLKFGSVVIDFVLWRMIKYNALSVTIEACITLQPSNSIIVRHNKSNQLN